MKSIWRVLLVAVTCLGVSACSKNASSLGERNAKLFQTAEPQIKTQWDTATAAIHTNGFVTAIVTLKKLQQAGLTAEQLAAVNATVTAVSDEMYEAANKGDARAREAIASLRSLNAR